MIPDREESTVFFINHHKKLLECNDMEIILFILVIILIFIIYKLNQKVNLLIQDIYTISWALKIKKVLNSKDIKESKKIVKGEKMAPLSLKDFMDE